ncbi:hypothetical protein [Chitinophaga caseinilytica]|uniref:DUF3575 domain-containing protein n=1 Tax=Chitinophaga caseinilytica TaxID=2267521 RepID=A0ABZ2YZ78_9BACT
MGLFAQSAGDSSVSKKPDVSWSEMPRPVPVIDKKSVVYIPAKGAEAAYVKSVITTSERRLGNSADPEMRLRLDVETMTTQRIYREHTELDYRVVTRASGFALRNDYDTVFVVLKMNGKDVKTNLGLKNIRPGKVEEIVAGPAYVREGKNIILHTKPITGLDQLAKIKDYKTLEKKMKSYWPKGSSNMPAPVTASLVTVKREVTPPPAPKPQAPIPDVAGSSLHDAGKPLPGNETLTLADKQRKITPKPVRISLMVNAFGGAGNRIVRVNQTQYSQDKPIKDRRAVETAIGAWGVHGGLGFNFGWSNTIAAEGFLLKEGFRSTSGVDWSTGKMTTGRPGYYDTEFRGAGIAYYYTPRKFLLQCGLYYTVLRDADEFGGQVSSEAWIGKIMIGYGNRIGQIGNLYIAPTLNYNFTALSKRELMTKLVSYGVTVGVRLTQFKKDYTLADKAAEAAKAESDKKKRLKRMPSASNWPWRKA